MTPLSNPKLQKDLEYLYALNGRGIRPGLARIRILVDELGHPQEHFRVIHVAGTNGKGSSCAIIASVLQAAGLRVGLYTSPHLLRFNERIRVNGQTIADDWILAFIRRIRPRVDAIGATFFETTTAMALQYFREQRVDYAVLETGLGGRWDATNIVTPELAVITTIGKDHEDRLGHTLKKIAAEKAGIAKAGIPCIVGQQRPQIAAFLAAEIRQRGGIPRSAPEICSLRVRHVVPDRQVLKVRLAGKPLPEIEYPLVGKHQCTNLQNALAAVSQLENPDIPSHAIREGTAATHWPGRLQILQREPWVFYDVGHNLQGIRQVIKTMKSLFPQQRITTVLGLGHKKKIPAIGKIIRSLGGKVYLTEIPGGRSLPVDIILKEMHKEIRGEQIAVDRDLKRLLATLLPGLKNDDILLLLGSHYMAPVVLPLFKIYLT